MEKASKSDGANRRRSQRRRPRTTVKIQCRKGAHGFGKNLTLQTLDISDCGVRVIVNVEMTLGGEAELLIEGFGVSQLKRLATVRWQVQLNDGTFCAGLEFGKRITYAEWLSLAMPD